MNELEENQQTVKKSGFGRSLIFGVIAGLSIAILAGVVLLNVFYHKGFVHIGVNGEIYVQDTATTEDEGIGSEVEAKLNAMDSLMDLFYMEDVDTDTAKEMIYKAYLASYGDKYTVYYTPDECKNLLESTTGKFEGIGAVCRKMMTARLKLWMHMKMHQPMLRGYATVISLRQSTARILRDWI